jgi:hypothetical protein
LPFDPRWEWEVGMRTNEPKDLIERALTDLEQLDVTGSAPDAAAASAIVDSVRSALRALNDSLGECREAVPYSTMRPVRGADGQLRWCCNHDPEHCGDV